MAHMNANTDRPTSIAMNFQQNTEYDVTTHVSTTRTVRKNMMHFRCSRRVVDSSGEQMRSQTKHWRFVTNGSILLLSDFWRISIKGFSKLTEINVTLHCVLNHQTRPSFQCRPKQLFVRKSNTRNLNYSNDNCTLDSMSSFQLWQKCIKEVKVRQIATKRKKDPPIVPRVPVLFIDFFLLFSSFKYIFSYHKHIDNFAPAVYI